MINTAFYFDNSLTVNRRNPVADEQGENFIVQPVLNEQAPRPQLQQFNNNSAVTPGHIANQQTQLPMPPEVIEAVPAEPNTFTGYAQDVIMFIRRRTSLQPQEM